MQKTPVCYVVLVAGLCRLGAAGPSDRPPLPKQVQWEKESVFAKVTPTRRRVSLDGFWRCLPMQEPEERPDARQWGWAKLPFPSRGNEGLFDGLFRAVKFQWNEQDLQSFKVFHFERDLHIPADLARGRFLFVFDNHLLAAPGRKVKGARFSLFVNDKLVRKVHTYGPGSVDITSAVRTGKQNRLAIRADANFRHLRWNLGLEALSPTPVSARYPYVVSDWRNKAVTVEFELTNHTDRPQEVVYVARFSEWKQGKTAHEVRGEPIRIGPRETKAARIRGPWKTPKEWTHETPNLYTCVLSGRSGSRTLDVLPPVRFGFREVWVDKGEILLNGKRLSLRGKSHNYLSSYGFRKSEIELLKATGQNSDRTHKPTYPPGVPHIPSLSVADEAGWLVTFELSGSRQIHLDDPEATRLNIRNALRLMGNHPSVIIWQRSGNGYVCGPHGHPAHIGVVVPREVQEREWAYKVTRMVNAIDPTRPYYYYRHGTGGNIRCIMTSFSYGTPIQDIEEWLSDWARTKQDPFMPTEPQIFSRPADLWQRGSKRAVLLEHHARFFGEKGYERVTEELVREWQDYGKSAWCTREYWMDIYCLAYRNVLRSWRTYGINGYLWHVSFKGSLLYTGGKLNRFGETIRESNSPLLLYIGGPKDAFVSKDHNYAAGATVAKAAILVNDSLQDITGKLTWEASIGHGRTLGRGTADVTVEQGRTLSHPIRFDTPDVRKKTRARITATLIQDDNPENGRKQITDTFHLNLFPPSPPPKPHGRIALIDSTGETAAVLDRMGLRYQLFNEETIDQGRTSFTGYGLLIVGKNSYPEAAATFRDHIPVAYTVKEGLNVLVLSQTNRNVAGLTVEHAKNRRAFIRAKQSPLFDGLTDEDMADWQGESKLLPAYLPWNPKSTENFKSRGEKHGQHNSFGQRRFWHWSNKGMVATFTFQKPQRGSFRVLLDHGFDLLYTPLVEFFEGKGRILFSQLDLVDHYGRDPVAALLLHRMVRLYSKPLPEAHAPARFAGAQEGKALLDRLGVRYATGLAGETAVAILNGDDPGPTKAEIERFVREGGALLVSLRDPRAADRLPVPLEVAVKTHAAVGVPPVDVFSGVSRSDLYYRKLIRLPHVVKINGKPAENGVLGVIPYGSGRITYVQVAPDFAGDPWQWTKVLRLYGTVLTNLGVASNAKPDLKMIGGQGKPREWLPGYANTVPNLKDRPVVENSPLYASPALDFDPDKHRIW